jgi:hypothetical protein
MSLVTSSPTNQGRTTQVSVTVTACNTPGESQPAAPSTAVVP